MNGYYVPMQLLSKIIKGARLMNFHFRLLFIFVIVTATAHGHESAAMAQVQNHISFFNGESLNNQQPTQCIGLIFEKNTLLTAPGCMKENIFSENTPVMDMKNSTIGYLSSTHQPENISYFKEDHSVLPESENFYIFTGNPEKIWLPVQLSKSDDEVLTFHSQTGEKPLFNIGAPVINDKGEIICLNNGNSYCEPPSRSEAFSISVPNKSCSLSPIPFPCTDVTWRICDTDAQVGIGQCHRKYDHALCTINLNRHVQGITGIISCHECYANWLDKNGTIVDKMEVPSSGCMSHKSYQRTAVYIVAGVCASVALAACITVLSIMYKKSTTRRGYEPI